MECDDACESTIAFQTRGSNLYVGDISGTLGTNSDSASGGAPMIAFSCKDNGRDATVEMAPTLRSMGHDGSHANGGGQLAVAFAENSRGELRLEGGNGDRTGCLNSGGGKPGQGTPMVITHAIQAGALRTNPNSGPGGVGVQTDCAYTLEARQEVQCMQQSYAVRRITPTECERLQGFSDGYTNIPIRKLSVKRAQELIDADRQEEMTLINGDYWLLAADGPRYKALGNSMAVPCMLFIGQRIQQFLTKETP